MEKGARFILGTWAYGGTSVPESCFIVKRLKNVSLTLAQVACVLLRCCFSLLAAELKMLSHNTLDTK